MAKSILISQTQSSPLATGGLRLSKSIPLSKIEEHPKFKSLYTIDEVLLERITQSIQMSYDNSQPVHIWVTTEDDTVHYYLIDGYTRKLAAEKAGLSLIPYYEHKFDSFDDAYKYVLSLQVNRRNLSGSELLNNVNELLGTKFIQEVEGNKSEAISDVLGVSKRTVERALAVNKAPEDIKEKVKSGELTVNQAYKEAPKRKKQSQKKDLPNNDTDNISDSLTDNSGNPAGLNFTHSDGMERPVFHGEEKGNSSDDKIADNRQSFLSGKAAGFLLGAEYVLSQILQDYTPSNIYIDITSRELSPEVMENLTLSPKEQQLIDSLTGEKKTAKDDVIDTGDFLA